MFELFMYFLNYFVGSVPSFFILYVDIVFSRFFVRKKQNGTLDDQLAENVFVFMLVIVIHFAFFK